MTQTFGAQVDAWVQKSLARQQYIIRAAPQKLFEEAQKPKGKGGLLPVDTAFLRSTFSARIGSMPEGPNNPAEGLNPDWEASVTLVITNLEPGETLFAGWSADYAPIQEEANGFMRTHASRWQQYVHEVTREAKARIR